jgi:hypothetical protein
MQSEIHVHQNCKKSVTADNVKLHVEVIAHQHTIQSALVGQLSCKTLNQHEIIQRQNRGSKFHLYDNEKELMDHETKRFHGAEINGVSYSITWNVQKN